MFIRNSTKIKILNLIKQYFGHIIYAINYF